MAGNSKFNFDPNDIIVHHTCTYSGTDLACVAGIYQNVSGSKVTVDKGLIGEVVHSRGNLTTELEQEGWKITGHHHAWPVGRTKVGFL